MKGKLTEETYPAQWPEGFFEEVVGGWQGKPLDPPPQSCVDDREPL